ncbi:hypothetical protein DACRYDRAFT_117397 [Dacryopinax primogenitus]|uniref:Uncharacterized protein n=1 Tax=Dacryopinax primogenitus (strain DJM 731) TaxID=1858805 RepID=M5FSJ8_DACPD|nr:uncharacterized protein DACRYDRAFT_117397 [Dacryopinax primogenitus]EJU00431.1 hypothetical protein DACRYDRAFT_117397 [Dacryopinax primogenitus]
MEHIPGERLDRGFDNLGVKTQSEIIEQLAIIQANLFGLRPSYIGSIFRGLGENALRLAYSTRGSYAIGPLDDRVSLENEDTRASSQQGPFSSERELLEAHDSARL